MSFNLLRMGLTWGVGTRAFNGGVFNRDWGLLTKAELKTIYDNITSKATSEPFGPFDVLAMLLGDKKAREIAMTENVTVRSMVKSKKRAVNDDDDDDDEHHAGPSRLSKRRIDD